MTIPREIQNHLESRAPGRAVLAALEQLLSNDAHLLMVDANERSISYRFGMHLQKELPQFHIDCEYNRTGVEPKRIDHLHLDTNIHDTDGKTVFPDVIAHIRGENRNYLVIEIKKTSSSIKPDFDLKKLQGYKNDHRLNYEFALFIELGVNDQACVTRAEWVDS